MTYIIAGLVLGGLYAIVSAGLAITYTATGVLNFAFSGEAYFIARFYYYLHTTHHWGIVQSAIASIVIASPLMGVALYVLIFRRLQFATILTKIVTTVGLAVAMPPLAVLCFGNPVIEGTPGLAPEPVGTVHVFGLNISMNQLIVLGSVVIIAAAGACILRWSDIGLAMRAMVDSPAMSSVRGTNPGTVSLTVWAATTFLAGLTGVLVAPMVGLTTPDDFTLLLISAFAALIAARMRLIGRAVLMGLVLGVLGGVVQLVVPPTSLWAAASLNSIPFVVAVFFIGYYGFRGGGRSATIKSGFLDAAIAYDHHAVPADDGGPETTARLRSSWTFVSDRTDVGKFHALRVSQLARSNAWPIVGIAGAIALPFLVNGVWIAIVGLGFAYGIVALSNTLIVGIGGLISLCQVTFAGVGGIATAQLATVYHWPVLASIFLGGVIALAIGAVLGAVSLFIDDIYLALVTVSFGALMDSLVFTLARFAPDGSGVSVDRPGFAVDDRTFAYVALAIFLLFALLVQNLRRSTTGLGQAAARWNEPGARSIGLNVLQLKVIMTAMASLVAGVGGGVIATSNQYALPTSYTIFLGLTWLAVTTTFGIKSIIAALVSGLSLAVLPAIFITYLSTEWGEVPTAAFGIGAILLARHPEGILALHRRQLQQAGRFTRRLLTTSPPSDSREKVVEPGLVLALSTDGREGADHVTVDQEKARRT